MGDEAKTEPLTDAMIKALRDEAGSAGDTEMYEIADCALENRCSSDRARCAEAINSARWSAADGDTPVLVVA